jgi:hypothetical protein
MTTFDTEPLFTILERATALDTLTLAPSLWGFGGVQGGVALALLTLRMQRQAEGRVLRQVSARFQRPLRGEFDLTSSLEAGRTVAWLSARASMGQSPALDATAIFSSAGVGGLSPQAPKAPAAPSPGDCPVFTVPPEFVPFASRTEVRPVGSARPFSGGAEPELTAWLRLVDDDRPPDVARMLVLMDSLAPSYAARLTAAVPIPTVTFSFVPGTGLARATSPWVLLRARTDLATGDGWLHERLDAFSPDGLHLGSAEQLRLVARRAHM